MNDRGLRVMREDGRLDRQKQQEGTACFCGAFLDGNGGAPDSPAGKLAWIDRYRPEFGPGVRERFAWTRTIDPTEVARAGVERDGITDRLDALLGADAFLLLPTGPGIAPRLGTAAGELEAFRARAFALLCIAGLARLPQISLPLGSVEGLPVGLSVIAPRGRDRALLDWIAARLP